MALIVGGVTVTGTQVLDATKLSGTLPAISAENLTNIPAGSSIPTVSYNTVGSFAFIKSIVGNTSAGASHNYFLRYSNSSASTGTTPSGTWRNMQSTLLEGLAGVWQRQS
tara:strand:+ start:721 stop:1050 length:330 start_codon:yes stop_codon:yes gene_type:complete